MRTQRYGVTNNRHLRRFLVPPIMLAILISILMARVFLWSADKANDLAVHAQTQRVPLPIMGGALASPPHAGSIRPSNTDRPSTTDCGLAWRIVPSQSPGSISNYLSGVVALSANDAWLAGGYNDTYTTGHTLIEHWDGTQWSIVPSANTGARNTELYRVSASSTNDVWAVGTYESRIGVSQTLVEHWDGTQWSIVPSPNVGDPEDPYSYNTLFGVSVASAGDVWAVGQYYTGQEYETLAEHWDGSHWSIVPSPKKRSENY